MFLLVIFSQRKHAALPHGWVTTACVLVGLATALALAPAGCNGGGPGDPSPVGGGSVSGDGATEADVETAELREVQLVILKPADLQLKGADSGVIVTSEGFPRRGLRGPRYPLTD